MRILLKDETIDINGLDAVMLYPLMCAARVWQRQGVRNVVITSARDGEHMKNSKHYDGHALDLRTRTLPDPKLAAELLQNKVGDQYDVVLESDHIHVEFDPA